MTRMMLISNSYMHGRGYLEHCAEAIQDFLQEVQLVTFVPYALKDWDAYAAIARSAFVTMGLQLVSVHEGAQTVGSIMRAEAFFVGGGNTFRLLEALQRRNMLGVIRQAVKDGSRYIGASAGANIAGPTIKTTNDMPIVSPRSFDALGLVPFQINPHYVDPDPGSTHMGETREARIREYHEVNDPPVLGLREKTFLRVEGEALHLKGEAGARLFRKGREPVEHRPGERLDFLLRGEE